MSLKRMYDIVFSIVFIILTGWIMLITALIIKLHRNGPVFYKAKRVGLDKKEIKVYKFRSMIANSGAVHVTTLSNDDRIYPFGRFIRKSKIDELPQLFNVFFGTMSVVGPRPEDVDVAKTTYVGKYEEIYTVKPGLTSPASLFDYTHGEMYEDEGLYEREFLPLKLEIERYYVHNHSFFYDIKITTATAIIILQKLFGKTEFALPTEYYKLEPAVREHYEAAYK